MFLGVLGMTLLRGGGVPFGGLLSTFLGMFGMTLLGIEMTVRLADQTVILAFST